MADFTSHLESTMKKEHLSLTKLQRKNHTHVKKVGHTSEFPFGIYWWTLKNSKYQNFEDMRKNCQRFHHSTHVYQKPQSYEAHGVRQFFFCHFGLFVALYTPQEPRNSKFQKNEKSTWRCHYYKLQKTLSNDACLLR